ncbi:type VI immunity family protein [Pyxidicoccus trucidator]|uniref:type VI immunity family protein n=1 Tax=Pyxidicoccus trucidator TaxID=2709662 RepID=UPI0013DCA466|nr:type VI immunity family protein [Pyxidicoccus trucidator]
MSEHFPRIRLHASETHGAELRAREVVRLVFYLPHDHHDLAPQVSRALDLYVEAVGAGPDILSHGEDLDGARFQLGPDRWDYVRSQLRPFDGYRFIDELASEDATPFLRTQLKMQAETSLLLTGLAPQPNGFSFSYRARLPWRTPPAGSVSVLSATLPTEYLEEHGPGRVRELAVGLASLLSFSTGHAGLAFELYGRRSRALPLIREALFRHPGLDLPQPGVESALGTRIDGVHWLNFLGPPMVDALRGLDGLRHRLDVSPVRLLELNGGRAVVSLGTWPEAGDLARGDGLPAYRELARTLEPWLNRFEPRHALAWAGYSEEEVLRWWRRLLG